MKHLIALTHSAMVNQASTKRLWFSSFLVAGLLLSTYSSTTKPDLAGIEGTSVGQDTNIKVRYA